MTGAELHNSFENNEPVVDTGVSKDKKNADFQEQLAYQDEVKAKIEIDMKIGELFEEFEVSSEEQDNIVKRLLKFKDNKEVFNSLLDDIYNNSYSLDSVYEIINGIDEKEEIDDKKEEIDDKKEEIDDKKEEIDDKKEEIDDKKEEIDIQEKDKIIQDKEVKTQQEERIRYADLSKKLINITSNLNESSSGYSDYSHILKDIKALGPDNFIEEGKISEFKEIIDLLKTDEKALQSISKDLIEQDKRNGTNTFAEFKQTLISIDSSFVDKFPPEVGGDIETTPKLSLGTDNLKETQFSGDTITQKIDEYEIEVQGQDRRLGLDGEEYKLSADIDDESAKSTLARVNERLKKELSPINEAIKTVMQILNYVELAILRGDKTEDVKKEIQTSSPEYYAELGLANMTELSQIKQALVGFYKKKDEEKNKLFKEKRDYVNSLIKENARKAAEKDKKVKETLVFLHSIGFDKIPKSVTDTVISNINLNKGKYGLTTDIDLKNGVLGFNDGIEGNSPKEKEKFIRLFNRMISGDPEKPIPLIISTGTMSSIQPEDLKLILESDLMKVGGVGAAMENLSREK